MADRAVPGLGLTAYWDLGVDGWKPGMDYNLLLISVLLNARCNSRTTSLPGTPTLGDIFIIPIGDPNANKIAIWDGEVGLEDWVYYTPIQGVTMWVTDEGTEYFWNGFNWTPKHLECLHYKVGDETTAITAGTGKLTFRMPYSFRLLEVRASLTTGQASGTVFTVDLNEGGVSVLSTKVTIDNGTKTSVGAFTPAVISDATLAGNAEMTIDVDSVGVGTAAGLKIDLLGYRIY